MRTVATCADLAALIKEEEGGPSKERYFQANAREHYLRAQRYFHAHPIGRYSEKKRDDFLALAAGLNLSIEQGLALYLDLERLSRSAELRFSLEALSRAGDPTKNFVALLRPLNVLSEFSKAVLPEKPAPRYRLAARWLENELDQWANPGAGKDNSQHSKEFYMDVLAGFETEKSDGGNLDQFTDYPRYNALRRWYQMNVLMAELISQLIKKRDLIEADKGAGPREMKQCDYYSGEGGLSETVNLIGNLLPALYTKYSGRPFYPSNAANGKKAVQYGVKFLRDCQAILDMEISSPHTIEDYFEQVRKHKGG